MWPFKTKQKEKLEPSLTAQTIMRLEDWRAVGDEFTYMGRTMIVSGHYRVLQGIGMHLSPGITADYADDLGVIRNIQFSAAESVALMNKQPNT